MKCHASKTHGGKSSSHFRPVLRCQSGIVYGACKTVPLDLEVLRQRYQKELRWQLGNPEREDFTLRLWIEAIEEEREV